MEIYYSKSKLVKTFLLTLLMTFAAVFVSAKVFYHLFIENRSVISSISIYDFAAFFLGIVGILGILLFGTGMFISAFRLFDSKPQVIISSKGIEDKRLRTGIIEWNDVALVFLSKHNLAEWLTLNLHSPEIYYSRLPTFELFLRWINGRKGKNDLSIRFNDLDASIDDAWNFIENNVIKPREAKDLALMP